MRYVNTLKNTVILLPMAALALLYWAATSRADALPAPDLLSVTGGEVLEGHRIELFPTGDEYTAARLKLIRSAKRSIYWAAFSWAADSLGSMYLDELCKKSAEGVDVRILVDKLAGVQILNQERDYLTRCNLHILGWDSLHWGVSKLPYALHEKLIIVDGESVITGGTAQRDQYRHASRSDPRWHDMDIQFDGPVACWFHKHFSERWGHAVQKELETRGGSFDGTGFALEDPLFQKRFAMKSFRGCEPVVRGNSRVAPIYNDPSLSRERPIREAYMKVIRLMQPGEEIRIFSSYFIPDQKLIEAINEAARRGVRVRVLSNSTLSNDESNNTSMAIIMAAREVMKEGVEVSVWSHTSAMHRKGIIFGNRLAVVGSDNFDKRSQDYSSEAVIFTDDPQFIATLTREWELDIADSRRYDVRTAETELSHLGKFRNSFIRWIRKYY